jgi:hypothetical protein
MKVAINTCFGGFGLSEPAFEKLLERKGIAFEKEDGESKFIGASYYKEGMCGDAEGYLAQYEFYEDRSDSDLIAVIEEFKEASNSWAADIAIVEIPDDVEWYIHEYDGMEHVAEKHRTWYGD